MNKKNEQHSFSIEMSLERSVRKISYLDEKNGHFFFEGFLGKLQSITLVEDVMLEIEGKNGVIKLDITRQELEKDLTSKQTNNQVNNNE